MRLAYQSSFFISRSLQKGFSFLSSKLSKIVLSLDSRKHPFKQARRKTPWRRQMRPFASSRTRKPPPSPDRSESIPPRSLCLGARRPRRRRWHQRTLRLVVTGFRAAACRCKKSTDRRIDGTRKPLFRRSFCASYAIDRWQMHLPFGPLNWGRNGGKKTKAVIHIVC